MSVKVNNIKVIVIDSYSAILDELVLSNEKLKGKMGHDEWRDYGINAADFVNKLKSITEEVVFIVGGFGLGKSYGTKYLNPGEWIYYNCDKKNLPYKNDSEDWKKYYGTKVSPGSLHKVGLSFDQIIAQLELLKKGIKSADKTEEFILSPRAIAFIIGHTEEVKGKDNVVRERIRIQGKAATKFSIAGMTNYYLAPTIVYNNKVKSYKLKTNTTTGIDDIRSAEGCFDELIDNNYQEIYEKIVKYNG